LSMPRQASVRDLTRMCTALSVDTRVRIIQLLRERPLCVNALAARLEITHSAVSQHLRVLREAGLVLPDRRGTWVHYRLDEKRAQQWADAISGLLGGSGGE